MRIAVLGTGVVGQTLAARFDQLGHDVMLGTRSPAETLARTQPDSMGNPGIGMWAAAHEHVRVVTFQEAAAAAELVVNATNGEASLAVLAAAGADSLTGKVVLDVANPLDFAHGFPPTLSVANTDSLGEQVQRAFPDARVVKSLNTMTAHVMAHPEQVAGGDHSVFVSGDDPDAKRSVTDLLTEMGHTDVIDLGDLSTARGTEMYLPLWLRLLGAVGTPMFNVKVVR